MKISDAYPGTYIKSADLKGRDVEIEIDYVSLEEVEKGKDDKPVMYFKNAKRGMVLNKTNGSILAEALGDETDAWNGQKIVLYPTRVDFQGKQVDAIRIRMNGSPNAQPLAPVVAAAAAPANAASNAASGDMFPGSEGEADPFGGGSEPETPF